jgi:hypothetical protein
MPTTPAAAVSPFEPVLRHDVDRLPKQFVDQYLVGPDDDERTVLTGEMDRVWHRPRWIWPILRVLAVVDIIFPEEGTGIPSEMVVEGMRDPGGGAAQLWLRSFAFPSPRRFDAVMTFDPREGRVVEWLRPRHLVQVVWDVTFEPPATMRIRAERIRVGRGRWRFGLPRWLGPVVTATETADGGDHITITLVVHHRALGDVFGYEGRFRVHREPRSGARRTGRSDPG